MGRLKKKTFYELIEENKKLIINDQTALDNIELKIVKKHEKLRKLLQELKENEKNLM